jgi:5'-nucleotidase
VRILVTNDDGIASPGLHELARAMLGFGEVLVVAPLTEHSGASAAVGAIHLHDPLVHDAEIPSAGDGRSWAGVAAVEGPPALCVLLATVGAFGPRPDLVVSGINPGANIGGAVYHSGTVGAAVTARNAGVHGIAVSQALGDVQRWSTAGAVAAAAVGALLAAPPPDPTVISVNVPNTELHAVLGVRTATIGHVHDMRALDVSLAPVRPGVRSVSIRYERHDVELPTGSDLSLLAAGYVTVTTLARLGEAAAPAGFTDGLAAAIA